MLTGLPAPWHDAAGQQEVRSGTGFFVSAAGRLLTSAHVVAGCRNLTVWPSNAPGLPATVVSVDQDADVALLRVDTETPAGTPAAAVRWPRVGDVTYSVAFGVERNQPRKPHFTSAVITDMSGSPDRPLMVLDTRMQPGSSGAPLIDADGVLLGMVIGRLAAAPNRAIGVPAVRLTRPLAGARLGDMPPDAALSSPEERLTAMSALVQCAR